MSTDRESRQVCRCGHLRALHAADQFGCVNRYRWDGCSERLETHRSLRRDCDCDRFRPARWLDEHSPWRHITARLWWALTNRQRWAVCEWWDRIHRERLCWCDVINAALKADPDWREDYDDLCDVPLPWDAGNPTPGHCYCPPERGALGPLSGVPSESIVSAAHYGRTDG